MRKLNTCDIRERWRKDSRKEAYVDEVSIKYAKMFLAA